MQKALTELEKRGLVYSRRTTGRFVTDSPEKLRALREELAGKEIKSFLEAMRRLGYSSEETAELLGEAIMGRSSL